MFSAISKLVTRISAKVLNVEDYSRDNCLSSLLEYKPIFIHSVDLTDFLMKLRVKHLINDIIITDLDGVIVASTSKDLKEGFKSAAMYNYINSELNKLSIILIESDGWHIIFKNQENIYFMKANDSLSRIEVTTIIDEIDGFLKCIV
ncbi:MAG: hypothetical protein PHU47_00760 [Candidatus ainarchaeum sp.]|nr:hypothetical protein [Candidatus ainarchaeum sp.]